MMGYRVGYNDVAIFGGSFNPPHIGHQITCLWLKEALGFSKILLIPTYEHAFGKTLVPFVHRFRMCEMLCAPFNNNNGTVSATSIEEQLPHPNKTLDTLMYLRGHLGSTPRISLVIGSDITKEVNQWYRWNDIVNIPNLNVLVVGRSGHDVDEAYKTDPKKAMGTDRVYEYPVDISAVSSTDIRNKINNGEDIAGLVPYKIREYIITHGLYK